MAPQENVPICGSTSLRGRAVSKAGRSGPLGSLHWLFGLLVQTLIGASDLQTFLQMFTQFHLLMKMRTWIQAQISNILVETLASFSFVRGHTSILLRPVISSIPRDVRSAAFTCENEDLFQAVGSGTFGEILAVLIYSWALYCFIKPCAFK